jgi:hypothetical protein
VQIGIIWPGLREFIDIIHMDPEQFQKIIADPDIEPILVRLFSKLRAAWY